ncbi:MAG: zinc metallopeptidase [Lentisphaeria bacterium]|nr:zinc metallopeptidase [Lentisphaeria bacterium]
MLFGFIDPLYLMFALPGFILALIAELMVKGTFAKYDHIAASSGMTGAQAAYRLLQDAGIYDVQIEETHGFLSDHYDPTAKKLRLSPGVFRSQSLSAIGVACHEAGHAIQHKEAYAPLNLRSALVPIAQFSSPVSYFMILAGFLFQSQNLILLGAIFFGAAVLFSLVTLPVEYNASSRAKRLMQSAGIVTSREASSAGAVLNAAFMTYVASAVNSLLILLYYLVRAGVLGGRRD